MARLGSGPCRCADAHEDGVTGLGGIVQLAETMVQGSFGQDLESQENIDIYIYMLRYLFKVRAMASNLIESQESIPGHDPA